MKKLISDTNIFITVALNLPKKEFILEHTQGYQLVAPSVLTFEIGNALSAMAKRQQILSSEAIKAYELIQKIPVEQQDVDIMKALKLATQQKIYAYDGYFLQLALDTGLPILTLDKGMRHVAKQLQILLVTDEK